MDSKPDDHDPDLPPGGSAEDLEEALKWLEDLTARQSKVTDLANPVPAASLDSPFRGLIDDDEEDLPDWLREAPVTPADDSYTEADAESRLDWLAKMAQRESIEELPTLEWRRLSEPVQSAIIARSHEPQDVTPLAEETTETVDERPLESLAETQLAPAEDAVAAIEWPETPAAPADDVSAADWPAAETPDGALDVVAAAEEELALTVEAGEELPPLDDLDAAMAWIEELAASQDAPIEDIPSVADRALASKLMMEAGLSPEGSILDELGSDSGLVEGLTPTHPFIEEEDFADTVVLVETIAADQGITLDEPEPILEGEAEVFPVTPTLPATPGLDDFLPSTAIEEPEALSFEDAMAILDEIAVAQQSETEIAVEPLSETLLSAEDDDYLSNMARDWAETKTAEAPDVTILKMNADEASALSAAEAPWNETPGEAPILVESPIEDEEAAHIIPAPAPESWNETPSLEFDSAVTGTELPTAEQPDEPTWIDPAILEPEGEPNLAAINGQGPAALEAALAALDALALPPGRTLDDLDARLQTAQLTPWRDVTSALDWLESALAGQPSNTLVATPVPTPVPTPVAEQVAAPDMDDATGWFDRMPEDPDAVLAWLEQMAAAEGGEAVASAPDSTEMTADVAEVDTPAATTITELGEADLLAMPDDPDEAMAWLESLAHGGPPAAAEPVQPLDEAVGTAAEAAPLTTWPVEEEVIEATEAVLETGWSIEEDAGVVNAIEAESMPPVEEVITALIEAEPETSWPVEAEVTDTAEVVPPYDLAAAVPSPAPEDVAPPAPKRSRGRPRKTAVPPAVESEEPVEPPPPTAKPKKSWVDLLKPLD